MIFTKVNEYKKHNSRKWDFGSQQKHQLNIQEQNMNTSVFKTLYFHTRNALLFHRVPTKGKPENVSIPFLKLI